MAKTNNADQTKEDDASGALTHVEELFSVDDEKRGKKEAGMAVEDPVQRPPSVYKSQQQVEAAKANKRVLYIAAVSFCFAVLLAILIVVLHFTIGQADNDKNDSSPASPNDFEVTPTTTLDPDWAQSVQARQTTPMDPFDNESPDCSLGNYLQPHVTLQCDCQHEITVVADDIKALYEELKEELIRHVGLDNLNITSCDPRNQALLWLASGDTRQGSDWLLQRYIMAVLYMEWFGPDWDDNNNWWSDASECTWLYVMCDREDRVVSVALDEINLYGTLPTELALLTTLRTLALTRNHLESTIPTELFLLTNLEMLSLYDNQLTGSVPSQVGLMSNLWRLKLGKNELSGALTTEIGLASSLQELTLGFNTIQQPIPSEIGQLTQLTTLGLEENRFSSILPTEIGLLSELRELTLSECLTKGPIPSQVGQMTALETLQLFSSGFEGTLPTELGNARALNRLDINDNKIVGPFPSELGYLTDLFYLTANENQLTGAIPTEFGLLTNMTRMELFGNDLSGTVPSELGALEVLDFFQLYQNPRITGTMPQEICDLKESGELTLLMVQCFEGDRGVDCPDDCCNCRPGYR